MPKVTKVKEEESVSEITKWVHHLKGFGYEIDVDSELSNPPLRFGFKNNTTPFHGMIDFYRDDVEVFLATRASKYHYDMNKDINEHTSTGWGIISEQDLSMFELLERAKILVEIERIGKPS